MALLALFLTAGCGAPVAEPAGRPTAAAAVDAAHGGHPADPPAGPHLRTGPLPENVVRRTGARLTLAAAAARVNLRAADLPGLLYRVSTPDDSGLVPSVTGAPGAVWVGLRPTGGDGPDTVDILLNRAVRWHIRLTAGAGEQHLDLAHAQVDAVDLGAGVGLVRLRLPRPAGTVPINLIGSVGRVEVTTPADVPVRVRTSGAVAALTAPGVTRTEVPAGTALAPRAWAVAIDRYHLEAGKGMGNLTVRHDR